MARAGERTLSGGPFAGWESLHSHRPSRYAFALLAVGVAFALRIGLAAYLGPPYVLFYPTVMLVALLAGPDSGLLATAASVVLAAVWILPADRHQRPMDGRDVVSLAVFAAMGALVSVAADRARRSRVLDRREQETALRRAEELVRASEESLRQTKDAADVAGEALRRSENLLAAVTSSVPGPIFLKDRDGRYLFANPAALHVLERTRDEAMGRTDAELMDDAELARRIREVDLRVMESGVVETMELLFQGPDGPRTYLATKGPFRDLRGTVVGVIGTSRDVTDLRRAEEQARQAQKLESIGRLAGGIAHDFNNLLVGILGYSDYLARGIRQGNASLADVMEIRKAGERARDLTRQLLAVARRQVIEPRPVDPNDVLRDFEKLLLRLLGEDVEVRYHLDRGVGTVFADPSQLQQVVMNLAVNARDAMPDGGQLTIETAPVMLDARYADQHPEVVPGPHVLIAVTDTGAGMSAEVRAHLFEPFFTTKGPGLGTGLGLATVHGIVKQARGHIWVYSEPGRGTTFKIYLPVHGGEPEREREPPPKAIRGGGERILLVEDDPGVRALALRVLREAGYDVLEASNGREALAAVAACPSPPALLATDVVMPEMSGRQLATTLERELPSLRVLYVSGYAENAVVQHGVLEAGVDFLAKPYTPPALLARVREVLDRA